ncbi:MULTISPECIES: transporter substrate-binding domain-containing protein [unclassified Motilimonas]|uniref:substrate-binding periplasmic protein n=1 Tax=Motilimonas TaxID=1914248 RepID=UPI001E4EA589|nr:MULTISPECIES: transporter substrate-binding domain-containing protein [unclassified Motilimonas]MCE0557649.1 transporter substrate-binding domain-containing protein [Motilimonas sp. E26]MDO6526327.1 transporter substrate-binding domain-containing protein [Motilimonas sp. 1_MG-2023]
MREALIVTMVFMLVLIPKAACSNPAMPSLSSPAPNSSVIVATDEWPPFRISIDKKGGFTGFDIDLLQALSAKTGIQFNVKRYPWARALSHMEIGQVDMMVGLAKTAEREQFIDYIPTSYYHCRPAFYTQKDIPKPINSYQDLYFYRVGYVLDSAYFEPFDSDDAMVKHGVPTEIQLLRMAKKGHLEVFIGTDCQVEYEINKRGLWQQLSKAAYQPKQDLALYIGFSKLSNHRYLSSKIEQALKELMIEPEFTEIKARYFGREDLY